MMTYFETVAGHAYAIYVSAETLGVDLHDPKACSFCLKNSQFEFLVECAVRELKADNSLKPEQRLIKNG